MYNDVTLKLMQKYVVKLNYKTKDPRVKKFNPIKYLQTATTDIKKCIESILLINKSKIMYFLTCHYFL